MNQPLFNDIRPSPIAGAWYPGDPDRLRSTLNSYLAQAEAPEFQGELRALVLPHAGLMYSGLTAAHALKALEGLEFERILILSPSHQAYRGHLLTSAHQAYQTPLGLIPVDHDSIDILTQTLAAKNILVNPIRRDTEHSIEIELPFLQHLIPKGFNLIPLMMMDQSKHLAETVAQALYDLILSYPSDEKTLLIASSDLSHFYHQRQAKQLDQHLIDALQDFDLTKFYQLKFTHSAEACGHGTIATVLLTSRKLGADQVTIADYRTSGDVSQDFSSVVGYVSAIISGAK